MQGGFVLSITSVEIVDARWPILRLLGLIYASLAFLLRNHRDECRQGFKVFTTSLKTYGLDQYANHLARANWEFLPECVF